MVTDAAAKTSQQNPESTMFVDVALPVPLRRSFTYRLRKPAKVPLKIGARVIVPFGKRKLTGYAVGTHDFLDPALDIDESKIRDVIEVVDEEPLLTAEILSLTQWAAGYYASSWGEMLKGSLPAGINSLIETVLTAAETEPEGLSGLESDIFKEVLASESVAYKNIESAFGGAAARKSIEKLVRSGVLEKSHRISKARVKPLKRKSASLKGPVAEDLSAAQQKVVETLSDHSDGLLIADLKRLAGVSDSPIKSLNKKGLVDISEIEVERDPLADSTLPEDLSHKLTHDQENALAKIVGAVNAGGFKTFLLNGVTGSGKTEVYVRAMKRVLKKGRTAMMLVPEIALTPVFSRQLRSIFGRQVAILHSSLSSGERYDEWRRIRRGDARVVIGTRSAVFAPLEDVGLIVVDEEHDASYRQHEMPFYHGRDTAVIRARNNNAVVVMGSATPAIESKFNAAEGKYTEIELPNRVSGRDLATAELIDMRDVDAIDGRPSFISPKLRAAIEETHRQGEQAMILLNRRGFSQFVLCRSCGESIRCRNCEITLTFHRGDQKLVCHYCSFSTPTPENCPECDGRFLYFLGEGTEQIEDLLGKDFPGLRIARVDRDTTRKKGQLEKILEAFGKHEIDLLVGTQMIAKGHDFPNVTLVGVVSVDAGLAMPDFRSAERTFQLLTQAAGRAGRGDAEGRVLIQTYYPDHYALTHALEQDYQAFYEREVEFRRRMHYPPFVALAQIMFKHRNFETAFRHAKTMFGALKGADRNGSCIVLGPAPAPLSRLKGEYRVQILVKSRNRKYLHQTIDIGTAEAEAAGCDMRSASVEIDPINLL
ncbi:MAG: primosomal protein N' [Pyrinomonadaceae bacterium]|nr:primosomal protein N' [Pyrinomonadaceae bacterium]